jgi:molecular chaperone DnaK
MIIGIDFGTTNTAVAVLKDGEPSVLSFGEAQNPRSYVPSIVAVNKKRPGKRCYGVAAKDTVGTPDWSVFPNFKMLFGEPETHWRRFWGDDATKAPEELAKEFFNHLFALIEQEHGLKPGQAVVTIPDIWQNQNPLKREELIKCFKDLGLLRKLRTESEPVAAASYYLHCFKKKYRRDFSGHLLVCDCGGGTLDFCLARVDNNGGDVPPEIRVLVRAGNGTVNDNTLGHAGVAFDQAVVDRLLPGLREREPRRYYERLGLFEERKINRTDDVATGLQSYRGDPLSMEDEELFPFDERVDPAIFCEIFDAHIKPDIDEALRLIKDSFARHDVKTDDPDHFRVVLVGGFSRFYLVQEAVGAAVGRFTGEDQRFADIFTHQDRALAIAKGAALIANSRVKVTHNCPYDVGIILDADEPTIVLEQGVKADKYLNIVWVKHRGRVAPVRIPYTQNPESVIRFFVQPREWGKPKLVSWEISKLDLAGFHDEGDGPTVEIGLSMDEDQLFRFHARDVKDRNKVISVSLGILWQGLIVVTEEKKKGKA